MTCLDPRPRVLAVGDPGQLPPVERESGLVVEDLDGRWRHTITQIFRQQGGSQIIEFVSALRGTAQIRGAMRSRAEAMSFEREQLAQ